MPVISHSSFPFFQSRSLRLFNHFLHKINPDFWLSLLHLLNLFQFFCTFLRWWKGKNQNYRQDSDLYNSLIMVSIFFYFASFIINSISFAFFIAATEPCTNIFSSITPVMFWLLMVFNNSLSCPWEIWSITCWQSTTRFPAKFLTSCSITFSTKRL